mgnify:CR=1 FL=1
MREKNVMLDAKNCTVPKLSKKPTKTLRAETEMHPKIIKQSQKLIKIGLPSPPRPDDLKSTEKCFWGGALAISQPLFSPGGESTKIVSQKGFRAELFFIFSGGID